VPVGCRAVLDAGDATDWATIELHNNCEVVSLDSSAEGLHPASQSMLASVEALPYAVRSLDTVIGSQVLR